MMEFEVRLLIAFIQIICFGINDINYVVPAGFEVILFRQFKSNDAWYFRMVSYLPSSDWTDFLLYWRQKHPSFKAMGPLFSLREAKPE